MAKIGIFYGSTTGNAEGFANRIGERFEGAEIFDISDASPADFEPFDVVLMGTSSWGEGELQDDWDSFADNLDEIDFGGKTVGFFGCGDQDGHGDTFCDGMGVLHDKVAPKAKKVVGAWPAEGYEYENSMSVRDGKFVGLAIDEDNQDDLTDGRIETWAAQVKAEIG